MRPRRPRALVTLVASLALAAAACRGHDDSPGDESPAGRHQLAQQTCPRIVAPYLFQIEKDGRTSYVLGTRHAGVSLDGMPDVVTARLRASRLAVFEIAPDDKSHQRVRMRGGPSLVDAVGAEAWAHYAALVGPAHADRLEHAPPYAALILLSAMYEDFSLALDKQLEAVAASAHVPTAGLETAAFQDELIARMLDVRALRSAIATTPERATLRADTVRSLARYCQGESMEPDPEDEKQMRAAGYSDAEIDAFNDALLYSRNRAWVPKLEAMFAEGNVFVAVGAGHLKGKDSVLAGLTRDGYTVTRVSR